MSLSIHDILSTIRAKAQTERQKGRDFERLMKLWFLTDPRYGELRRVWLWEEFPARGDHGAADRGIDLVALTSYGDYWAIQSKCYAEDAAIAKGDVDSFLANASRTFRDPQECRVLCNVRCLSEGVDVPALDAVLFLSPRNSEVEVVQSVGRVMRSFRGKKYGYIIIPVIVPTDVSPEEALADNERFRVVWDILNALRSHDENFNAHVNKIHLNKKRPPKIVVAAVPRGSYTIGHDAPADRAVGLTEAEAARQLELQFGTLQGGIYARLVEKVGDKMYWEHWARSIGDIALKFTDRINLLISENDKARQYFADFLGGLHSNINDSIDQAQAVEMLAQHMITRPVFDALFSDYRFVRNNTVSRSMQDMLEVLEDEGLEMETQVLERYCDKTDPKSRIRNDANDWSREHHQPRYILDLLLAVVSVSIKTADIVAGLPTLDFE